jgi:hypothetical protein
MKLSTRMMLAMVSLVLMTAAIIGWLNIRNIESVVLPRALGGIQARASLLALDLEASVRSARADALGFRSAVAVEGMIRASKAGGTDPTDGTTVAQWLDRLAPRFAAELAAKPSYSEFRIIGAADGGRELLRVDRLGPGGAIRIVPPNELQTKGEREFFRRAIELAPGSVVISDVELKQDNGVITLPPVPVVRAAAPIHDRDGKVFGAVVINVDLREAFERIRSRADQGIVYLVNARGDYLIHPDRSREFGFEFARPYRLQDDFPTLEGVLGIEPDDARLVQDRSGDEFGVAPVSVRLAQGPVVTLILAWPYRLVFAPALAVRSSSLVAAGRRAGRDRRARAGLHPHGRRRRGEGRGAAPLCRDARPHHHQHDRRRAGDRQGRQGADCEPRLPCPLRRNRQRVQLALGCRAIRERRGYAVREQGNADRACARRREIRRA